MPFQNCSKKPQISSQQNSCCCQLINQKVEKNKWVVLRLSSIYIEKTMKIRNKGQRQKRVFSHSTHGILFSFPTNLFIVWLLAQKATEVVFVHTRRTCHVHSITANTAQWTHKGKIMSTSRSSVSHTTFLRPIDSSNHRWHHTHRVCELVI